MHASPGGLKSVTSKDKPMKQLETVCSGVKKTKTCQVFNVIYFVHYRFEHLTFPLLLSHVSYLSGTFLFAFSLEHTPSDSPPVIIL